MKNPFAAVTIESSPCLKILLYGEPGTGKSRAAATFPAPAIVDAENKIRLHAGMGNLAAFPARSLDDLDTAISFIEDDGGNSYKTLVVDSITVLYLQELERVRLASKSKVLDVRNRAEVNRRMDSLYARLAHLPVHLVVIARQATIYNRAMESIGVKPDSGGDIGYTFEMVIHMQSDYSGIIERETGQLMTKSNRLVTVNWSAFAEALQQRARPWHEKPEEIKTIIDKARKYFPNLADPNDIRAALFDVLDIAAWSDLGTDRTIALNIIADKLKDKNPQNSSNFEPGSGTDNSFAKTVANTRQKAGEK